MHLSTRRGAGLLAGSLIAGLVLVPLAAMPAAAVSGADSTVFINEFHYDNAGADTNEFVEVAGPAGTDLSGWSIVLYNGNPTQLNVDKTVALSGTIAAQQGGYGTVSVAIPGIQNGDPDGIALVRSGAVVQFLSYGGSFTPVNGPAAGQASTNLPVKQSGTTAVGSSLALTGSGDTYGEFTWTARDVHTSGAVNAGQTFTGTATPPPPPPPTPTDNCGDPAVRIHQIQGSGATFDPAYGGKQSVEGVVTAVASGLSGYYLQEEAADQDADPTTSEGIFVRAGTSSGVTVGQHVRATGTVAEFASSGSSQTQLGGTVVSKLCGTAIPAVPIDVSFPLDAASDAEHYEGMLTRLVDTLVISEAFNYDRFGEVVMAKPLDGQGRLYTPTAVVEPGADAQALAAEYTRRIITIDDLSGRQNPTSIPHPGNGLPYGQDNRFRLGDTITGVTGVVDHTFGLYRLQPTAYGEYVAANPRSAPPVVGGDVQVASFNVLNYFLSTGNACGPTRTQECRGANRPGELERQRAKILAALVALDADVVGLMEMENTPGVEPAADLVAGLNALLGAGTYDYVDTGVIGTDAIRLGLLYKPSVVRPAGDYTVLDSSDDPRFIDTRSRPMLTQTFDEVATGGRFTLSVNHLKSKGSACADDPDTGDGSGNCNVTRTQAAEAIVDFLATDPTRSGDPDHLVIGDLNSYDHEDPIDALAAGGFTDLIKKFGGEYAYGYTFNAQVGYLDHALANESLVPQVTGAAEWHVNADEPDILDYNLDFGRPATFYAADAYRSSDHDAVLVGLDLAEVTADGCYGDCQTVESYDPARRGNGTAVPTGHSDPSQALGMSDPDPDDPYWVTLGLGGQIVLEFDSAVQNNNGDAADLRVVDVVDGAKGATDAAVVSASWDGVTWVELGRVSGTGEVDLGSLPAAHFIRVVDATGVSRPPATDGFDLDAVEVLTGCV
ncbi:MAG: ExeM/NucH family extracellular endonuclease [Nocardioides sp.]